MTGKEFKALLYSVGEELTKAQTAEVFGKYAEGDKITREGYLEVRTIKFLLKHFDLCCFPLSFLSLKYLRL